MKRLLSIEELSTKLKPLFGEKIDQLYFKYLTSNSNEEKIEILQLLTALYQKNLSNLLDTKILLEPPPKELVTGEYTLGNVVYNEKELYPFNLREQDWSRHICVTGMSGSGKTNLALNILSDFIKKSKPFLVFDWKKSFRPLVNKDPSLMIFTVGNESVNNFFKLNINRPPKDVSPKEWINVLCDLLTESFAVSFGVHKVLLETLDEIFEKWGVYSGFNHYPNWEHVKKMLEIKAREAKKRESAWYESALRIASVLTFGSFGKVINYDGKKSLSVEDLFDKRVILELNSLGNIEKKFFCEYLLTYIYKLKKANQFKDELNFNYAILVDEAHNIFLKNKTNFLSESVTDMVYREMREYGISLICLDQHISKISDTVKGNSACHIAFQQQLPEDIYDISSLMQMFDRKEIFSKIPVGYSIVKLAERYNSSFLIKVPLFDFSGAEVGDEKIKSRMDFKLLENEIEESDKEFKKEITFPSIKNAIKPGLTLKKSKKRIILDKEDLEVPLEVQDFKRKIENIKEEYAGLTPVQKELFLFIQSKLDSGRELKDIENLLEQGLSEKLYSFSDVLTAINYAMEQRLKLPSKSLTFQNKNNLELVSNQLKHSSENLPDDEKKFVEFLRKNPNNELNTTSIYSSMGFSTRKGNVIKKRLIEKNLIKVQEQRTTKGWQKFIRLA
ncbi:MAG: DUF87 domain-containing protein [Candidatus Pacearchaeota archaeon]|jgi:hypothetical protein